MKALKQVCLVTTFFYKKTDGTVPSVSPQHYYYITQEIDWSIHTKQKDEVCI